MEQQVIHHRVRTIDFTLLRSVESDSDCPHCPDGLPDVVARCTQCDSIMAYRGLGTLRNGQRVHFFECVHSPGEVHSKSFVIAE